MRAYRVFTGINIGLANGERLQLAAGGFAPPSWVEMNQGSISGLVETGALRLVANADRKALEAADAPAVAAIKAKLQANDAAKSRAALAAKVEAADAAAQTGP
jgi:hypothetical protein